MSAKGKEEFHFDVLQITNKISSKIVSFLFANPISTAFSFLFLLFLVLLNLNFFFSNFSPSLPVKKEIIRLDLNTIDPNWSEMNQWPKISKGSHKNGKFIVSDPNSVVLLYLHDCWNDENTQRLLLDPYCHLLWMITMDSYPVVSIEDIRPFSSQNEEIGMTCHFSGPPSLFSIFGNWRTCNVDDGSEYRSFKSEIIAYHLDRILGFYRSFPVIPRLFHNSQLSLLTARIFKQKEVQSIIDNCGKENYIDGVMIAIPPPHFVLLAASEFYDIFYFSDLSESEIEYHNQNTFAIGNSSSFADKTAAMEIITLNIFSMFLNYNPPMSSLQVISDKDKSLGPILYTNRNFANFKCDDQINIPIESPLSQFCKFPKRIAERLLAFDDYRRSKEDSFYSFSQLISKSINFYQDFISAPLFENQCHARLNHVANYLIKSIRSCITIHGRGNVLIEDAWNLDSDYLENLSLLIDRQS